MNCEGYNAILTGFSQFYARALKAQGSSGDES
jgi:hypothetical protein